MILPEHSDFRQYTDEELEVFVRSYPNAPGIPVAVRELEHRRWVKSEVAAHDRANAQDRAEEKRHQKTLNQGSTILWWTKFAVIVGVVAPILVGLIQEIPLSKLLRAIASESQPRLISSMKMILETPAPTAQPSESPQASPTPSPAETPIKFPPPAP